MKYNLDFILNNVVFACAWGSYVIAERSTLEGVHAVLCAKEIFNLLNSGSLTLEIAGREHFDSHDEGKEIVINWAKLTYQDAFAFKIYYEGRSPDDRAFLALRVRKCDYFQELEIKY